MMRRMATRIGLPLFLLLLLFSCREEEAVQPYSADEAEKLAAEIRRHSDKPDRWVIEALEGTDTVNLVDGAAYGQGLEVLKYLLPLLHSRGITNLDLWFIPDDGLLQANALLRASRFFADSAAELSGRTGYLTLYEEHIDFLRYLYDFNHNLEEGEEGITLAVLPEEGEKGIIYSLEGKEDIPNLYIQNPLLLDSLEEGGEKNLKGKLNQLIPLLEGRAPFFLAGEGHFLWDGEAPYPLLIVDKPGNIAPCHPFEGGINRENFDKALADFPDQMIRKPPFLAVFFMERAQRIYLRNQI